MKILVTGAKGQLGYDVCKRLSLCGIEHCGVDIDDFDITDRQATDAYLRAYAPDAVIHCSAFTAVDRAEDEVELCRRVNAEGTANLADSAAAIGAKMLYISTDYVFSGEGDAAYAATDEPAPLSVYGKTKLEGELSVKRASNRYFIVRISWVFGKNGNNFVKTMLRLSETREELNVVCDQIGSPTYTFDLSILLCDMIQTEKYGIYHATNEGLCSWAELAEETMRLSGRSMRIHPIPTTEYPTRARRPLNSRMRKDALDIAGFARLPHWKDALSRYLAELGMLAPDATAESLKND